MQKLRAALVAFVVFMGGCSASPEQEPQNGEDQGALGLCDVGLGMGCHSDTVKPAGWPLPAMVDVTTESFPLPRDLMERMHFVANGSDAFVEVIRTSPSDAYGIACSPSGPDVGTCTLHLLVEAASVTDPAGQPVRRAPTATPIRFEVHGRMANFLRLTSRNGQLGPLSCTAGYVRARCEVRPEGIRAIVSPFTPKSDGAKSSVEAAIEPPQLTK